MEVSVIKNGNGTKLLFTNTKPTLCYWHISTIFPCPEGRRVHLPLCGKRSIFNGCWHMAIASPARNWAKQRSC